MYLYVCAYICLHVADLAPGEERAECREARSAHRTLSRAITNCSSFIATTDILRSRIFASASRGYMPSDAKQRRGLTSRLINCNKRPMIYRTLLARTRLYLSTSPCSFDAFFFFFFIHLSFFRIFLTSWTRASLTRECRPRLYSIF